jgi:hypothetical protein
MIRAATSSPSDENVSLPTDALSASAKQALATTSENPASPLETEPAVPPKPPVTHEAAEDIVLDTDDWSECTEPKRPPTIDEFLGVPLGAKYRAVLLAPMRKSEMPAELAANYEHVEHVMSSDDSAMEMEISLVQFSAQLRAAAPDSFDPARAPRLHCLDRKFTGLVWEYVRDEHCAELLPKLATQGYARCASTTSARPIATRLAPPPAPFAAAPTPPREDRAHAGLVCCDLDSFTPPRPPSRSRSEDATLETTALPLARVQSSLALREPPSGRFSEGREREPAGHSCARSSPGGPLRWCMYGLAIFAAFSTHGYSPHVGAPRRPGHGPQTLHPAAASVAPPSAVRVPHSQRSLGHLPPSSAVGPTPHPSPRVDPTRPRPRPRESRGYATRRGAATSPVRAPNASAVPPRLRTPRLPPHGHFLFPPFWPGLNLGTTIWTATPGYVAIASSRDLDTRRHGGLPVRIPALPPHPPRQSMWLHCPQTRRLQNTSLFCFRAIWRVLELTHADTNDAHTRGRSQHQRHCWHGRRRRWRSVDVRRALGACARCCRTMLSTVETAMPAPPPLPLCHHRTLATAPPTLRPPCLLSARPFGYFIFSAPGFQPPPRMFILTSAPRGSSPHLACSYFAVSVSPACLVPSQFRPVLLPACSPACSPAATHRGGRPASSTGRPYVTAPSSGVLLRFRTLDPPVSTVSFP